MKNLWTFGCSFTYGDGTLERDLYKQKYKRTERDLAWTELLANELKLNLVNCGLGGISNETILDILLLNWDRINEDDVVIIGKTWSHRFDFPKTIGSSQPQSIVYRGGENDVKKWFDDLTVGIFNDAQIECIKVFSVDFATQPLYSNRHDNRFNFIKNRLIKDKKVNFCHIWDVENLWNKYNLIVDATNNEIRDHHWSYKGHNDFFRDMLNIIKTPKFI
jgi:hypothetical protein